jgi:hypothetical protein
MQSFMLDRQEAVVLLLLFEAPQGDRYLGQKQVRSKLRSTTVEGKSGNE